MEHNLFMAINFSGFSGGEESPRRALCVFCARPTRGEQDSLGVKSFSSFLAPASRLTLRL
jgi:hypothetical protein